MSVKKEQGAVIEPAAEQETKFNMSGSENTVNTENPASEETAGALAEENGIAQEEITSLDLLWQHVFNELDEWGAHGDIRDENFLKAAQYFVDSVKRNQDGLAAVADQFSREFLNWEKSARDEFLMSTTSLQHFFPLRSYEEINQQIDNIQTRTLSIISKPVQTVANLQLLDRYLQMIDQYISLRKKSRIQYIRAVKQAGNLVYENQKGFVNLFAKPLKAFILPFNKYLDKQEEMTKS